MSGHICFCTANVTCNQHRNFEIFLLALTYCSLFWPRSTPYIGHIYNLQIAGTKRMMYSDMIGSK